MELVGLTFLCCIEYTCIYTCVCMSLCVYNWGNITLFLILQQDNNLSGTRSLRHLINWYLWRKCQLIKMKTVEWWVALTLIPKVPVLSWPGFEFKKLEMETLELCFEHFSHSWLNPLLTGTAPYLRRQVAVWIANLHQEFRAVLAISAHKYQLLSLLLSTFWLPLCISLFHCHFNVFINICTLLF